MSYPPPITKIELRVSTGSSTNVEIFEQDISPSALSGTTNNSVQIMPNTAVFNAFNTKPPGTIFNSAIVATYNDDIFGPEYIVITPNNSNFVPRQITPTLSLADIPNKLTTDSSFSLSVTTNSTGVLSYSSSALSVATVNTTTGLVTLVGAGTTTITVNLAASANGVYAAATASTQLVVSVPAAPTQRGFSVLTDNSDFASLDFDSGMTTLFTNEDEFISGITMPNSNFMFDSAAYTTLYLSSNAWLSFGTNVSEFSSGNNNQQPINTFRFFGLDHVSSGYYKFISNNTRLLIKLTGYIYGSTTKTFTIKLIIEQSGEIRTNYTLSSTFTSNQIIIIGFVGANSSITSDDIFLTLSDSTFNGSIALDLYSLLNGKTILFF